MTTYHVSSKIGSDDNASSSTSAPGQTPVFNSSGSWNDAINIEASHVGVGGLDAAPVTVTAGSTATINGPSAQSVTFTGSTGTLVLNDAPAYTGQVSGLT